jgi:hypothetical protein
MAVVKLSVSLPAEVATKARQAAERTGQPLSTWLAEAARKAAELDAAQAAVEEYQAVYGTPTRAEMIEAHIRLLEAGVGLPETPDEQATRLAALERIRNYPPPETVEGPAE